MLCFKLRSSAVDSLTGTLASEAELGNGQKEFQNKDQKALTLWSTSYSTVSVTTTSYLTGTTITATLMCSAPNSTQATCVTA